MSDLFTDQWKLMDAILDTCHVDCERLNVKSFKLNIDVNEYPTITMVFCPRKIRPFVEHPEGGEETTRVFRLRAEEIKTEESASQ